MLTRDVGKTEVDVLTPTEEEKRLREQLKKLYRQLESLELEFQGKEEALKQAIGLLTVLSRSAVEQEVRPLLDQLYRGIKKDVTPSAVTLLVADIKERFARETVWEEDDEALISESGADLVVPSELSAKPLARKPLVKDRGEMGDQNRLSGRSTSTSAPQKVNTDASDEHETEEKIRTVFSALIEQLHVEGQKELYEKAAATKAALVGTGLFRRLSDVRLQLLDLLASYRKAQDSERARLEEILKELIAKLAEIEKKVLGELLANHKETMEDNAQFAERLEGQMLGMQEVAQLRDLDAVRTAIVSKTDRMRAAIQAKREADQALSAAFEEKVHSLEQKLQDAHQQLSSMTERAYHDAFLEGVYNRLAFNEKLQQEISLFARYRVPVSLILFDMDRFKQVNDTYGHQAGDLALQMVVSWVKPTLRQPDIFARFGGDEFALILPNTSLAGAVNTAERIRTIVNNSLFLYETQELRISLSMGVAAARTGDSAETLLSRADQALYLAKEKGRNQVRNEDEIPSSQTSTLDKMVGFLSRRLPFRKENGK
jgi:diguanylate cyclase (GGDEF)-like protein